MLSNTRVADRHLRATASPDPGDDKAYINEQIALVNRLIAKGEARRLGRTSDIRLLDKDFDGNKVWARVQGTTGRYDARITIRPTPGFNCTCPDRALNGPRVGPCKHVLRLAEVWLDVLVEKLESM